MGEKREKRNKLRKKNMMSKMLKNAWIVANSYFKQNFNKEELQSIRKEVESIFDNSIDFIDETLLNLSYTEVQGILSNINEKTDLRKLKGVFYTPNDVAEFILQNSVKMSFNKLTQKNISSNDLKNVPVNDFCFNKTIFDPTCGTGVFLLAALDLKLRFFEKQNGNITNFEIKKIVSTIKGNDSDPDSIAITKLRVLIYILNNYGVNGINGLSRTMTDCYSSYDYVTNTDNKEKFDIIIGNPPYVEDSKSGLVLKNKYGNIYANVLENATLSLNESGVIGFVIPLSYVSTIRMKKIRDLLYERVPEQYVLSYSDRPDSLFSSVHQKLCILFGRQGKGNKKIYTSGYQYWYKYERQYLFSEISVFENENVNNDFILKLGNDFDFNIYNKINKQKIKLIDLMSDGNSEIYLNMRAAFWIKAFCNQHKGSEYKKFLCKNKNYANFCMCLLNSSLFWWYWTCISDCWHITKKELSYFTVPELKNFEISNKLAKKLESKLEKTKVYVGTKQVEYEYKHKDCISVIHEIDNYINKLYELSDNECEYIKNYSYKYRTGGENGNKSN